MGDVPRVVLAVAGSDSSAGAGAQADLKTLHACGAYAVTAITAVTAQTPDAVHAVHAVPAGLVRAQLRSAFERFTIAAVKTGMLVDAATVEVVAASLVTHRPPHVVVDPVLVSTSGTPLLNDAGLDALRRDVLPHASVATPNRSELARLAGMRVETPDAVEAAAQRLLSWGCRAVIVTGGADVPEDGADWCEDLLVTPAATRRVRVRRERPGLRVHGTGCTHASALAAHLARGDGLEAAAQAAARWTAAAIRTAIPMGTQHAVIDPWRAMQSLRPKDVVG